MPVCVEYYTALREDRGFALMTGGPGADPCATLCSIERPGRACQRAVLRKDNTRTARACLGSMQERPAPPSVRATRDLRQRRHDFSRSMPRRRIRLDTSAVLTTVHPARQRRR